LQDGTKVYAYEVDGLGNSLYDFDDPNLPSLLAVPLLNYKYYSEEVCWMMTQQSVESMQ
jgi:meiotically up-regulated gene 157 (Mug157) protein